VASFYSKYHAYLSNRRIKYSWIYEHNLLSATRAVSMVTLKKRSNAKRYEIKGDKILSRPIEDERK
jgi:hypothetical protein